LFLNRLPGPRSEVDRLDSKNGGNVIKEQAAKPLQDSKSGAGRYYFFNRQARQFDMWQSRTSEPSNTIDPPSFPDYFAKNFRRINAETFCQLYDDHPNFDRVLVVDCRTKAEYEGGHIKGAIRRHPFFDDFDSLYPQEYRPTTLFIFHCEFSAYRAPAAITKFQELHKAQGRDPSKLHAFVLDGGFSQFWEPHKEYCVGKYLPEFACLSAVRL
jgi:rhodanese-related sulfurtransferase